MVAWILSCWILTVDAISYRLTFTELLLIAHLGALGSRKKRLRVVESILLLLLKTVRPLRLVVRSHRRVMRQRERDLVVRRWRKLQSLKK